MDFVRVAINFVLQEYPLQCLFCFRQLNSKALKYSDRSSYQNQLILDICCTFCGQLGQIELEFPQLGLLKIRGNFSLTLVSAKQDKIEPLQESSVLAEVEEILRRAR